MIKAILSGSDGKQVALLGLAFENLDRLREGQPILVRGRDLGINCDILIHAGKDEVAVLRDLEASGLKLPEPTKIHPTCPDDDTPLEGPAQSLRGSFMFCPKCKREFGVIK